MSDIPDWAFNRVVELAGCEPVIPDDKPHVAHQRAFARYIAEHEEPPVDPLLIEAREIVALKEAHINGASIRWQRSISRGEFDDAVQIQVALAALRRGIEIGEGK